MPRALDTSTHGTASTAGKPRAGGDHARSPDELVLLPLPPLLLLLVVAASLLLLSASHHT
jgi:hypothetical protein